VSERFDVYGFRTDDLEEARNRVEESLSIRLRTGDSSYWGLYYLCGSGARRDYMLYRNTTGEWSTGVGANFGVILLVNNVPEMDHVRQRLVDGGDDPVLLRSRDYPDSDDDDDA